MIFIGGKQKKKKEKKGGLRRKEFAIWRALRVRAAGLFSYVLEFYTHQS